jgi:hypothetical protein
LASATAFVHCPVESSQQAPAAAAKPALPDRMALKDIVASAKLPDCNAASWLCVSKETSLWADDFCSLFQILKYWKLWHHPSVVKFSLEIGNWYIRIHGITLLAGEFEFGILISELWHLPWPWNLEFGPDNYRD